MTLYVYETKTTPWRQMSTIIYAQFIPCLEVNMLCTVVRQGQRNALHVRLIMFCHITTVHTEWLRLYQLINMPITCVNVVQSGCIMWLCFWWMVSTIITMTKVGWIMFLVTWTQKKVCTNLCSLCMFDNWCRINMYKHSPKLLQIKLQRSDTECYRLYQTTCLTTCINIHSFVTDEDLRGRNVLLVGSIASC